MRRLQRRERATFDFRDFQSKLPGQRFIEKDEHLNLESCSKECGYTPKNFWI